MHMCSADIIDRQAVIETGRHTVAWSVAVVSSLDTRFMALFQ